MSWNLALNLFTETKQKFISLYGKGILWNYNKSNECCLWYWARLLNDEELLKKLSLLEYSEKDGLLLLHYTAWWDRSDDTPFWERYDGLYRECRSVTIDIHRDTLVHVPFRKFFNLGEMEECSREAVENRIKNARTVEFSNKLDGSMVSMRYYPAAGHVLLTTSKAVDKGSSWRLQGAYRMFYEKEGYERLAKAYPTKTFIYEYISQEDAHVVNYAKEQEGLYLIGARDVDTGEDASYREVLLFAEKYNIPTTVVYETSLDKVLISLGEKKSNEAEGFVLNIDGFKVKIKYDDYVKMHPLLSVSTSPNVVIEAIADGRYDDFISRVPQAYRHRIEAVADKVFSYLTNAEKLLNIYYEIGPRDLRKRFAIWAKENVPKILFPHLINKYDGVKYNLIRKHEPPYAQYPTMEEIERNTETVVRFLAERNREKEER